MNNSSLSQQLFTQLQGAPMQQIAQQLGTNTEQASAAVSQALPLLMGALGKQASSQPQGVQNLFGGQSGGLGGMLGSLLGGATQSSQQGGLGGLLSSVLGGGNSQTQPGAGGQSTAGSIDAMLGSVFGGRQAQAEEGLGKASGLGSNGAHALLVMLAPIVISFLGQRFMRHDSSPGNAPALDTQDLNQALAQEEQQLQQQGAGNLLNSLLDQNGDGKLDMNDVVKLGASLLGGRR